MNLYVMITIIAGLALLAAFVFHMNYLEPESLRFEVTNTTRAGEPMQISSKYATIRSEIDMQKTEFQVGEEITVSSRLVNLGPERVPIMHGKPLFIVSVYDIDGNLVWQNAELGLRLALGILRTLDVGVYPASYSFVLDSSGQYTVKSQAEFSTREPEEKDWRLYTNPITITVLPDRR